MQILYILYLDDGRSNISTLKPFVVIAFSVTVFLNRI